MDVVDVTLLAIVQRAVALIGKQVGKAQDSVERGAQFMAHRGEKLILELTCALCFFLRVHHELFCPLTVGDVAQDAGEKEPRACLPAGQGKFYGKLRSVLSLRSQLNRLSDHVCFTGLQIALEAPLMKFLEPIWHKNSEGFADHFSCGIAEDCLGPAVEICNASVAVGSNNGIVGCLHHTAKLFFTGL